MQEEKNWSTMWKIVGTSREILALLKALKHFT